MALCLSNCVKYGSVLLLRVFWARPTGKRSPYDLVFNLNELFIQVAGRVRPISKCHFPVEEPLRWDSTSSNWPQMVCTLSVLIIVVHIYIH